MRVIKVTYSDGDFTVASINGTKEQIAAYYLGKWFNFGDTDAHPKDLMVQAVKVEFLGDRAFDRFIDEKNKTYTLARVIRANS